METDQILVINMLRKYATKALVVSKKTGKLQSQLLLTPCTCQMCKTTLRLLERQAQLLLHIKLPYTCLRQEVQRKIIIKITVTRMWANAQHDGRPAKHVAPSVNAAKFG